MIPEISVILPAYNAAAYISEAIESILNQSFKDFELLVINDGSTDNLKEHIFSFSDIRIRYIENEGNKGLIYTLNKGIEESKGKYIARMDADDIALPNRFELQYRYMETHNQVGVCGTCAEYIGDRKGNWRYPVTYEYIKCRLMWGSSIIHPTAFIRKSVLIQHQIKYNDSYVASEDYKLWVDLSNFCDFYNIPEVLLKYRVHNLQVTAIKNNLMNNTKTKIVFEQIQALGVVLNENDFDIIFKFITYQYNYHFVELNRLFEIYFEFMKINNVQPKYDILIINEQIRERLFESCYFSTKNCEWNSIKLYKKYYRLNGIGFVKKIKFYYKAFIKQ